MARLPARDYRLKIIRKLSRWIPARPVRKTPIWGYPILAVILLCLVYGLYKVPWPFLVILLLVVVGWRESVKNTRHLRALAKNRSGENICSFVRAFDCSNTDTWALRAVYEELSRYLQVDGRPVPICADDRWEEDLHIDTEDIEMDILSDIAHRAGRSLKNTKQNPYYGRVKTVRDLVSFLEHQPRLQNVEQIV